MTSTGVTKVASLVLSYFFTQPTLSLTLTLTPTRPDHRWVIAKIIFITGRWLGAT